MPLNVRGFILATCAIALPAAASETALPVTEKPPVLTAPYDPLSPEVQKEALAWVSRNAQPLAVPAQDLCVDPLLAPDTLKPIADALAKPRVIGIGELSHGDCESFAYKASLIRALILYNGVTVIGMEATIEGGRQLDAFIAPGQPALSGDALVAATNKALNDANVFGLWKTAALRDLLVWLRVHNQTAEKPVHFANFDTQDAATDSQYAVRYLTNALARPEYQSSRYNLLRAELASVSQILAPMLILPKGRNSFWEYMEKQNAVSFKPVRIAADRLVKLFAEAPTELKQAPEFGIADQSAFAFLSSIETYADYVGLSQSQMSEEIYGENSDKGRLAAGFAVRDRGMADSIVRIMSRNPNAKMALWAHNAHVGRSEFKPFDLNALSMGQDLGLALGRDYAVVDFIAYRGLYNPIFVVDINGKREPVAQFPLDANPYSLGAFYAKAGHQRFWLDLRKLPNSVPWELAWRNYPYVVQEGGSGATVRDKYYPYVRSVGFNSDITVFFNTVHPTVRIAAPKAAP